MYVPFVREVVQLTGILVQTLAPDIGRAVTASAILPVIDVVMVPGTSVTLGVSVNVGLRVIVGVFDEVGVRVGESVRDGVNVVVGVSVGVGVSTWR